jgi:hypothetical protein
MARTISNRLLSDVHGLIRQSRNQTTEQRARPGWDGVQDPKRPIAIQRQPVTYVYDSFYYSLIRSGSLSGAANGDFGGGVTSAIPWTLATHQLWEDNYGIVNHSLDPPAYDAATLTIHRGGMWAIAWNWYICATDYTSDGWTNPEANSNTGTGQPTDPVPFGHTHEYSRYTRANDSCVFNGAIYTRDPDWVVRSPLTGSWIAQRLWYHGGGLRGNAYTIYDAADDWELSTALATESATQRANVINAQLILEWLGPLPPAS